MCANARALMLRSMRLVLQQVCVLLGLRTHASTLAITPYLLHARGRARERESQKARDGGALDGIPTSGLQGCGRGRKRICAPLHGVRTIRRAIAWPGDQCCA
jgi:hypothetical protein